MKIVVTSDHHRSGDRSVNNFTEEKSYPKFIDACIRSKIDMHVKLGDIYELKQGRGSTKSRLKYAQQVFHKCEKADARARLKMKSVQLVGNHDLILQKKWNLPTEYIVQADGIRIYFTHGHIFDTIWKSKFWSLFGTAATEAFGWVERRLGVRKADRALNWMERKLAGKKDITRSCNDWDHFEEMVERSVELNCILGIYGHTHDPFRFREDLVLNRLTILNTECLTHGHLTYAYIDTKKRSAYIITYKGEKFIR